MLPRSMFFSYDPKAGDLLARVRGKVPISLSGWKGGIRSGKLAEVTYPKPLRTWPLKFSALSFVSTLQPDLRLIEIEEGLFVDFLRKEGAKDKSWMMRFWEIDANRGWSRTITAGREEDPGVWNEIVQTMVRLGRPTAWAGVDFTHPKLGCRVMIYRHPTASIAPWGEGGKSYMKVRDRFVNLLQKIV